MKDRLNRTVALFSWLGVPLVAAVLLFWRKDSVGAFFLLFAGLALDIGYLTFMLGEYVRRARESGHRQP